MIYRQQYRVLSSDADLYRRLRLSRMLTLMQEAAIAHTEALGAGREKTLDRGILWAVAMQRVQVRRLPEYDETFELLSWPGEMMHVLFPRYCRIVDPAGDTLAESSALWILMDAETRQRVFPESAGIRVPGMRFGAPPPLPRALPAAKGDPVPFEVPYSFADLNGHMNNARLTDLAEDRMPEALRAMRVRQIEAEYTGEARPGERLALRGQRCGSVYSLSGEKERALFRLRMEYAEDQTDGI